ncbi:Type 1 glutamine amidotransferase-like domain-containing protein [Synoicihabitans lomoniglobus]|uniref:Type 1 glutamine amidotransferase-like domain-containing protein n=1 Tax=Synoicihabitans lomoniglobus TaxID=2909285 RepID=A0AAF0CRX1_9BACT|nr:Type 1 glutamine amidotransferase-like domain-containing protein [Opitutaceae bacterium LMO-M01]WED66968.1 Type 1 glutamine amidotransferase-like domain-containing protein [Opitutaceae bacterium LMO-M01]
MRWQPSPNASVLVVGGAMMADDRFAPETQPIMREHYAGCRRIALMLHATHPDDRDAMERLLQDAFAAIGPHEAFSLHHYDHEAARRQLASADAIFTGGGETFWLLRELHESGQIPVIRERVEAGVPYGGSSAGANVAGLRIGATNDFPVTDIPTRDALGFVPFVLNPHHPRADHQPDHSVRTAKVHHYLRFNPTERVLALGDRAMARWHQGKFTARLGPIWVYGPGGDRVEIAVGQAVPCGSPKS